MAEKVDYEGMLIEIKAGRDLDGSNCFKLLALLDELDSLRADLDWLLEQPQVQMEVLLMARMQGYEGREAIRAARTTESDS